MSQRTPPTIDDLTGREVTDATHYHVTVTDGPGSKSAGDKYEIDLSADSHAAFDAMLTGNTAEFHAVMRKLLGAPAASGKSKPRSTGTRPASTAPAGDAAEIKRAREFNKAGGFEPATVKAWGREHGHDVKDGPGSTPSALVLEFAKAHGMPDASPATAPESSNGASPAKSETAAA